MIPSVLNCDRCEKSDRKRVVVELLKDGIDVRDTPLVCVNAVKDFSSRDYG